MKVVSGLSKVVFTVISVKEIFLHLKIPLRGFSRAFNPVAQSSSADGVCLVVVTYCSLWNFGCLITGDRTVGGDCNLCLCWRMYVVWLKAPEKAGPWHLLLLIALSKLCYPLKKHVGMWTVWFNVIFCSFMSTIKV